MTNVNVQPRKEANVAATTSFPRFLFSVNQSLSRALKRFADRRSAINTHGHEPSRLLTVIRPKKALQAFRNKKWVSTFFQSFPRFHVRDACGFVSVSRAGVPAMAAVDNPLFAEEDFSLFAGVGGFTAPSHRGWHGNKALVPPSPVFGTNETNETNPHRGETKRTRDSGTSSKARALARRNDHLEAELASLRTRSSLETTQSAKTKANALRHLKAVEEHVGLLVNESNAKLETLVAEREKENALDFDERDENESDVMRRRGRTNGEARETSTRHTGDTGNNHGSAACAETERLRDELVRFSNREAEMDAEAEERESELAQAVKRIESLTQALRLAGGDEFGWGRER